MRPATTPHPPHASICHGVYGPWPRKTFEASAASAPTAKPRRGPRAAPEATTITVTGCTPGMGAKSTRPAAAMPASVATSARSRVDAGPASSHAKPAPTTAPAARRTATRPRVGSRAAQAEAPSATALAARTHLDIAETPLARQPEPAVRRKRLVMCDDQN